MYIDRLDLTESTADVGARVDGTGEWVRTEVHWRDDRGLDQGVVGLGRGGLGLGLLLGGAEGAVQLLGRWGLGLLLLLIRLYE